MGDALSCCIAREHELEVAVTPIDQVAEPGKEIDTICQETLLGCKEDLVANQEAAAEQNDSKVSKQLQEDVEVRALCPLDSTETALAEAKLALLHDEENTVSQSLPNSSSCYAISPCMLSSSSTLCELPGGSTCSTVDSPRSLSKGASEGDTDADLPDPCSLAFGDLSHNSGESSALQEPSGPIQHDCAAPLQAAAHAPTCHLPRINPPVVLNAREKKRTIADECLQAVMKRCDAERSAEVKVEGKIVRVKYYGAAFEKCL